MRAATRTIDGVRLRHSLAGCWVGRVAGACHVTHTLQCAPLLDSWGTTRLGWRVTHWSSGQRELKELGTFKTLNSAVKAARLLLEK